MGNPHHHGIYQFSLEEGIQRGHREISKEKRAKIFSLKKKIVKNFFSETSSREGNFLLLLLYI